MQRKRHLLYTSALCVSVLYTSACSTPQQGVEIRTVNVPTPVPCIPRESIPAEPASVKDSLTGNAAADLPIVAASAILLRSWGREMSAALHACADTPDK